MATKSASSSPPKSVVTMPPVPKVLSRAPVLVRRAVAKSPLGGVLAAPGVLLATTMFPAGSSARPSVWFGGLGRRERGGRRGQRVVPAGPKAGVEGAGRGELDDDHAAGTGAGGNDAAAV